MIWNHVGIDSVRRNLEVFAPQTRAVSIEVANGVAFLPILAIDVAFPLPTLERLTTRLLTEIRRVIGRKELHNHRALTDRLDALAETLSEPLQASTALVITAQARAISGAAARALAEELIDDPARDVAVLTGEINDFVREFEAVQEALKSNSALPAISEEAVLRHVPPPRTIPDNEHDAADYPGVIHSQNAMRKRKVGFDPARLRL